MDDNTIKDKVKFEEIMNEIANLKKYSKELSINTRGEKLENYINALSRSINNFEDDVEKTYDDNFNKTKNIE